MQAYGMIAFRNACVGMEEFFVAIVGMKQESSFCRVVLRVFTCLNLRRFVYLIENWFLSLHRKID